MSDDKPTIDDILRAAYTPERMRAIMEDVCTPPILLEVLKEKLRQRDALRELTRLSQEMGLYDLETEDEKKK